jgi:ABC-type multidrug transport system fused ATPase/permease subunit
LNKKTLAIIAIVFSALLQTASANPLWAHDEPHEQFFDQMYYYAGPWGTIVFWVLISLTVVAFITGFILFWLNRDKQSEGEKP